MVFYVKVTETLILFFKKQKCRYFPLDLLLLLFNQKILSKGLVNECLNK